MLENKTICRATEAKNINEYFIKDFMEDQKFSKSPTVTNYDTYHLIKLPDLTKEVEHIFKNSKHYR